MLAFGLEFAVLWAIVIAFLNYIPYIGSWIGVMLPVTLAVVQFGQIETVLMLLVALSATQFLLGNIIEPQVMGSSLDLSPYAILIGLTVWTSLWGIPGAIVSIPITAVLVIVLSEFAEARPIAILLSKSGQIHTRPKNGQAD
jgi:AI-2 transport protein TqsA